MFLGVGMVQWWEHSPPTNVAQVQFQPGAILEFSLLLFSPCLKSFPWELHFSSFHRTSYLQIPIPGPAWKSAKADVVPPLNIENSLIFLVNFCYCEIVLNVAYIVMAKGPSF